MRSLSRIRGETWQKANFRTHSLAPALQQSTQDVESSTQTFKPKHLRFPPPFLNSLLVLRAAKYLLTVLLAVPPLLALEQRPDGWHVFPGDNIQQAIEAAARSATQKVVKVHEGVYRPNAKRQALIWFNQTHDGVVVEAVGSVTLTAANPELSRPSAKSHPAVANHVVYFGHGVSSNTILRGFKITGGNGYMTEKFTEQMEPNTSVPKNSFFLTDGGGIKIFGQSGPTLDRLEVVDNFATPCAGGVSVQQQFQTNWPVIFVNCVFRNNRAQVTGAAIDLLEGSAAKIINCLFVGNVANTGVDIVSKHSGEPPFTNSGALTTFQNSWAIVQNCTFASNRNGIDDLGGHSSYLQCLFHQNNLDGGLAPAARYDLMLLHGGRVQNCSFSGAVVDPSGAISKSENSFTPPDPKFDTAFVPGHSAYEGIGYRPVR